MREALEMKILVTGGAGFIGSTVCEHLLKKDFEVVAFDNLSRKGVEFNLDRLKKYPGFRFVFGDVCHETDVFSLEDSFDGIFHFAANPAVTISYKDPRFDFEQNLLGTLNILELAKNRGKVPLIFAGTDKVYPVTLNDIPMTEERTRYFFSESYQNGIPAEYPVDGRGKGHSPYGASKLGADFYCQEYFYSYKVPVVIPRLSCIYGPYQRANSDQGWIVWFCIAKIKGLPVTIYGDGKQVRDCLFGEDLAKLLIKFFLDVEKFKGEIFNVGGGPNNTLSLIELVNFLDETYPRYKKMTINYDGWRPGDHRIYVSDIRPLMDVWKPKTKILDGVEKTFEWVERNREML